MKLKYYGLGVLSTLLVVAIVVFASLAAHNLFIFSPDIDQKMSTLSDQSSNQDMKWFEKKVKEIDRQLDKHYIEKIDHSKMYQSALKSYVGALGDPYTNYLTAEEFENLNRSLAGSYDGIGVPIVKDKETKLPKLMAPYKGSPAEKAGIKLNDLVLAVDGQDVTGITIDEIASLIRGKKGTEVVLTIQRIMKDKIEKLDITVMRDEVIIPTIEAKMLEDKIGYIQIAGFDEPTADQFIKELTGLRKDGIQGLIIDLRGNPGGYLETAREIADEIMLKGLVVYIEDKQGKRQNFEANNSAELKMPIAVLVDQGSASASEILAGALKDHKLATIVGTTTFGKGLVQNTIPFMDGSALKVTIAKYYTPNGNYIHAKGIEPDVKVELEELPEGTTPDPNKMDNQLQKAWEVVKNKIK